MADNVSIKDSSGTAVTILADQVTEATLGTGEVQYVKLMDGTLDSSNKAKIDGNGYLQAKIAPAIPTVVSGNQTLTVSTTVVTLTVPSGATHAFVTVETGDIRYWEDGTSPTSTTGLYLPTGASAELTNLSTTKFIKASGQPDSTIQVSYRKYI